MNNVYALNNHFMTLNQTVASLIRANQEIANRLQTLELQHSTEPIPIKDDLTKQVTNAVIQEIESKRLLDIPTPHVINTDELVYKVTDIVISKLSSSSEFCDKIRCHVLEHCSKFIKETVNNMVNNVENMDTPITQNIEEIEIEPEQVNTFKVDYHKEYLHNWINENEIKMDFDRIWEIREQCIKKLEE